ncbi:mammalian ependymin-related protein 1-like [Branchiostoma lanceolatum]|uniref:Hypp1978 protein n=1 Tax=Branchiostoma lanceolatum TaxID=7740 RepID=A0A8J9ZMH9_BRALA|nr:Hypp1978 [Branchiostoma lanceolatum]
MYAVVLAVTAVVASAHVSAQPQPCCTPNQWEATMVEAQGYVQNVEPKTLIGTIEVSYDFDNKKMAFNQMLNNSGTPVLGKVIINYKEGKMYIISDGVCTELDAPTVDMPQQCIKADAVFERTMRLGGTDGLEVNSFGLWNVQGVAYGTAQMTSSDCLPVTEVLIAEQTGQVLGSVQAIIFDGVTTGIKDPSVFDPPSPPCNSIPGVQRQERRSVGTPFFQRTLGRFGIPDF